MILVDSSVWIDHFREVVPELVAMLDRGEVTTHPFVVGELACGNLSNRGEMLELLAQLPAASIADHDEVMEFIQSRRLYSRGIGYVDVHLLASVAIDGTRLWTNDRRLQESAAGLGLAAR